MNDFFSKKIMLKSGGWENLPVEAHILYPPPPFLANYSPLITILAINNDFLLVFCPWPPKNTLIFILKHPGRDIYS